MLGKTLESPLDCKEIQPVYPKGNQSWIFIGRTDAEAETLIFWPPDMKSWLIGKDSDTGKDWRWEEKGMTVDKMVGWHHQLNGHEFEWTLGVGDGQGGLVCCNGVTKSRTWLNGTEHSFSCLEIFFQPSPGPWQLTCQHSPFVSWNSILRRHFHVVNGCYIATI